MKQRKSMCDKCPSRPNNHSFSSGMRVNATSLHVCHHDIDSNCAGILARNPKGMKILMDQIYDEAHGAPIPFADIRRLG